MSLQSLQSSLADEPMMSASQAKTPETQPLMRLSASEADRREGAATLHSSAILHGSIKPAIRLDSHATITCIKAVQVIRFPFGWHI